MKVTSHTSVSFPKLGWAISAGEEKELPTDKDAQEQILSNPDIVPVAKSESRSRERER